MSFQTTPAATRPTSRANTPALSGSEGLARVAGLPSVASKTAITREQYVNAAKTASDIVRDLNSEVGLIDGVFAATPFGPCLKH